MSWDVMLFTDKFPIHKEAVPPKAIGKRKEVVLKLTEILGMLENTDSSYIVYSGENLGVEIMLGKNNIIDSISLYIHGSGDATAFVEKICLSLNCVALDISSMEFIDFSSSNAESHWKAFTDYRDKVLGCDKEGDDNG